MSDLGNSHHKNELLRRMSAEDLALLQPHLQPCLLELKATLEAAGSKIEAAYFPEEGIGSVIARMPNKSDAEVGFIGFEGMIGSALVMGSEYAAHDCRIQVAGFAYSIDAGPFC